MFTYIDPTVRAKLVQDGKLLRIDAQGVPLDVNKPLEPGVRAINLMGPIPLPMTMPSVRMTAEWFVAVRSTELGQVETLARDLSARGGQHLFSHLASSMAVNSVIKVGAAEHNPLVRVHSSCLTGDVFGSERCDCGPQLDYALRRISEDPQGGYLVYMAGHEGRGIGLWAKAATYLLQDGGEDTYQANRSLGLPDDSRDFSDAGSLLKYFAGEQSIRLMTNNPKKVEDLRAFGLQVDQVKHFGGVTEWNQRYLQAKQSKGHLFDDQDIDEV